MSGSLPALERCAGDVERFAAELWGTLPALHRSGGSFDDLMSAGDVDLMLTSMSLRLPAFRLVKDGKTLPSDRYTKRARTGSSAMTGIADAPRVLRLFREGATIVLQSMHRYWLPLARFCRDLEMALGHPTQANAYITPPGSRGLAVHADEHDVFVLQSFGHKHWDVYETGRSAKDPGDPVMVLDLQPGDALYMPKGTPHGATAQEGTSGHLTIGILAVTWTSVVVDVLQRVAASPEFDHPLPAGYHRDPSALADLVKDRLEEARARLDQVAPREAAERRIHHFLTSRPPLLRGSFEDELKLRQLDQSTRLRRRRGSVCELVPGPGGLAVLLGDRELRMPEWTEPAMRLLAELEELTARDLAGLLEPDSRLVLLRRMVREGLLEVVGES